MRRLVYLCLLLSATAHAQLVTIDAGAHPSGTDLYSVTAGAKVFSITNNGVTGNAVWLPVITVPNLWATGAGANFFGHNSTVATVARYDFRGVFDFASCFWGGSCFPEFYNPLIVTFDVPTNFVEVRAHFLDWMIDGAVLRAYNSAGTLLTTCFIPGASNSTVPPPPTFACGEIVRRYDCYGRGNRYCKQEHLGRIQRGYPDIAYVLIGGQSFTATQAAYTQVKFRRYSDSCPTP
jgi:hypothetical protein